ncbi:MAG: hypothetical protein KAX44_09485, partial [Candidatus Brocadiae bacterium]|nr:hypothetical protein [Candidatus Brocadiia bacterium]
AASALRGIVAQRLVRRICPSCKVSRKPRPEELGQLRREIGDIGDSVLYYGKGCRECRNTGFLGRTAIAELLLIDDEVREAILRRAPAAEIRKNTDGRMLTMRRAGCRKVMLGTTTAEEVLRVTQLDDIQEGMTGE